MTKQKTKPHEPAFNYHAGYPEEGLTKREYFAAMALQGVLSQSQFLINSEKFAKFAVEAADALIAELNK
jgi:hypothetical protein